MMNTEGEFRTARQSLGWTQTEAGRALGGLHQTTIARIEAGRLPTPQPVQRLLTAYLDGYTPEDWPEEK